MNKREKQILKIGFKAGKKAVEMHPEDDSYDILRFEEAEKKVKKLTLPVVSNRRELLIDFINKLCKNDDLKDNEDYVDKYLKDNL